MAVRQVQILHAPFDQIPLNFFPNMNPANPVESGLKGHKNGCSSSEIFKLSSITAELEAGL